MLPVGSDVHLSSQNNFDLSVGEMTLLDLDCACELTSM